MTGKDYIKTQMVMIQMGQQATKLDLVGFLKAISNAETVGPVVDPTLYRRAMDNMAAIKKLAEATQQVKEAFEEMQGVIAKTAAETLGMETEDECNEHA